MREIRTSGSTRGEWAALCVAPSPTLPAPALTAQQTTLHLRGEAP
jgi:hypothetical protein